MAIALSLTVSVLLLVTASQPVTTRANRDDDSPASVLQTLHDRSDSVEDLGWLRRELGSVAWPDAVTDRSSLVAEKHRLLDAGDTVGGARLSAYLSAEAQIRANRLLGRWRMQIDPETSLLPKSDHEALWDYADAGADLFPHLLIAATLLAPRLDEPLSLIIPSERARGGVGLPWNIDLDTNLQDPRVRDRMYGAVEYAKDGLLPLTERLGPGPWLDRMQEIFRAVESEHAVQTRFGPIPSEESEVNGQALQVFSRLYWATGDPIHQVSADRIARAYLDLSLPATGWVPARTWDFKRERSNTSTAQLRDHGNEVVAGLVEYHLIETELGLPNAAEHRVSIRKMLDRLLDVGRRPGGMWESAIDIDTGARLKDTLSDNWGYLYAAYLTQAFIEERWPNGDLEAARRYRAAAVDGLRTVSTLDFYPWQGIEQDGYADTIESALYLLHHLDVPEAERWVDRQAGTLFGAQHASGKVEDGYLDGNFVRTALLYSAWQSGGARLVPWSPSSTVGAERDGACIVTVIAAGRDWRGDLVFDIPRSSLTMHLPMNYPRLNEWPEWFTFEPGGAYRVEDLATGGVQVMDAATLGRGVPMDVRGGTERVLRFCPAV